MSITPEIWPPTDTAVLDPAAVDALRELEDEELPDLFAQSTTLFFLDSDKRLDQLEAAVSARETDVARKVAHALKGAALVMGTRRFAAACAGLEAAAAGGHADAVLAWWTRVTAEYALAGEALQAEAARGGWRP